MHLARGDACVAFWTAITNRPVGFNQVGCFLGRSIRAASLFDQQFDQGFADFFCFTSAAVLRRNNDSGGAKWLIAIVFNRNLPSWHQGRSHGISPDLRKRVSSRPSLCANEMEPASSSGVHCTQIRTPQPLIAGSLLGCAFAFGTANYQRPDLAEATPRAARPHSTPTRFCKKRVRDAYPDASASERRFAFSSRRHLSRVIWR